MVDPLGTALLSPAVLAMAEARSCIRKYGGVPLLALGMFQAHAMDFRYIPTILKNCQDSNPEDCDFVRTCIHFLRYSPLEPLVILMSAKEAID